MIEELDKGFPPVIYFIEIRTPQFSLDQLKNLDKPCYIFLMRKIWHIGGKLILQKTRKY